MEFHNDVENTQHWMLVLICVNMVEMNDNHWHSSRNFHWHIDDVVENWKELMVNLRDKVNANVCEN